MMTLIHLTPPTSTDFLLFFFLRTSCLCLVLSNRRWFSAAIVHVCLLQYLPHVIPSCYIWLPDRSHFAGHSHMMGSQSLPSWLGTFLSRQSPFWLLFENWHQGIYFHAFSFFFNCFITSSSLMLWNPPCISHSSYLTAPPLAMHLRNFNTLSKWLQLL